MIDDRGRLEDGERRLREILATGAWVVAFSGGVDSAVVAAVALDVAPGSVLAMVSNETVPAADREWAERCAARLGTSLTVLGVRILDDPDFARNGPDRCAICRDRMGAALAGLAERQGLSGVVDGANTDDLRDYRPGIASMTRRGVRHPLIEAGLGKEEVRRIAERLGLPARNRPASPCLASRVPYGSPVTASVLARVEAAEAAMRELGFCVVRVRDHGALGKVEVPAAEMERAMGLRTAIVRALRGAGYAFAALDLDGFRSGKLNDLLGPPDRMTAPSGGSEPPESGGRGGPQA